MQHSTPNGPTWLARPRLSTPMSASSKAIPLFLTLRARSPVYRLVPRVSDTHLSLGNFIQCKANAVPRLFSILCPVSRQVAPISIFCYPASPQPAIDSSGAKPAANNDASFANLIEALSSPDFLPD